MKIKNIIVWIAFISLFFLQSAYALSSPIGEWKTIDDVTGKPKAIVKIWLTPNQTLMGRIEKIFPLPGFDQNELCTACKGERHNKRIVGMIILWDLKQNASQPNEWSGGQIFDPKNGKTYHSSLHVIDEGKKLNVRGYIGVPLFGRTQTWLRVSSEHA